MNTVAVPEALTQPGAIARDPSRLVGQFSYVIFWLTLLFQATSLKYIWGLESASRIVNIGALGLMTSFALYGLIFHSFDRLVWFAYIVPGLLVFLGMFVNITINAFADSSMISLYGLMLPWASYLMAPMLVRLNAMDLHRLWKHFYLFMVAAVALGLSDYVSVFYGGTILRSILTPEGPFLVGRFSLLFGLEDGSAHNRFYACFAEPGTLAMFLLPAMGYAITTRRILGLLLLGTGLFLTQSLGGFIGMFFLFATLTFATASSRNLLVGLTTTAVLIGILWLAVSDQIVSSYQERGNSRAIREENVLGTVSNLPDLLLSYPIGFPFGSTVTQDDNRLKLSTFALANVLQLGGIPAFLGYLASLFGSLGCATLALLRRNTSVHDRQVFCAPIVLGTFLVQRTTIWDSALYGFLFAPAIIARFAGLTAQNASVAGGDI